MFDTYEERVARFRIVRHDELPARHQAEMRINGIDPDNHWSLIWSFDEEEAAQLQLAQCIESAADWETFKLVDAGEATTFTRQAWL